MKFFKTQICIACIFFLLNYCVHKPIHNPVPYFFFHSGGHFNFPLLYHYESEHKLEYKNKSPKMQYWRNKNYTPIYLSMHFFFPLIYLTTTSQNKL